MLHCFFVRQQCASLLSTCGPRVIRDTDARWPTCRMAHVLCAGGVGCRVTLWRRVTTLIFPRTFLRWKLSIDARGAAIGRGPACEHQGAVVLRNGFSTMLYPILTCPNWKVDWHNQRRLRFPTGRSRGLRPKSDRFAAESVFFNSRRTQRVRPRIDHVQR